LMSRKINILTPSAGNHYQHLLDFKEVDGVGRVITTEIDSLAPAIHAADKCYRAPRIDAQGYPDALMEICRVEEIDWIVPLTDPDVVRLAESRELFTGHSIGVFSPPPGTVAVAADKYRTACFFLEHSIPHPATYLLKDVQQALEECGLPLFLKPRYMNKRAGGGYFFEAFDDREELLSCAEGIAASEDYVLQQYLQGQEVNVDFFCDEAGRLISVVPGLRISALAPIFTKTGGAIVRGETFHSKTINDYVAGVTASLAFFGAANLQGFLDGEGNTSFTEINPRFSGASVMTEPAGAHFHAWAVGLMRGEKLTPQIDNFDEIYMTCWHAPLFFKQPPLPEIEEM